MFNQKINTFSLTIKTSYICFCFWKHYVWWLNFMIIIQVTNKVSTVFFTERNLVRYYCVFSSYVFFLKKDFYSGKTYVSEIQCKEMLKVFLPIFLFENKLFMFHKVLLFLFKSVFCSKFTASILLIPVIIQRQ